MKSTSYKFRPSAADSTNDHRLGKRHTGDYRHDGYACFQQTDRHFEAEKLTPDVVQAHDSDSNVW